MNVFCIAAVAHDPALRTTDGIIDGKALRITYDARQAADCLLQQADDKRRLILQTADAEAQQAVRQAQERVALQAEQLLGSLEQMHHTILAGVQDLVIDMSQQLFERLVLETTSREKIEAVWRRLQSEAPPKLISPVLWAHPDDMDAVPDSSWELKADPRMPRGACKLEATTGEWRAEFDIAVAALASAFDDATKIPRNVPKAAVHDNAHSDADNDRNFDPDADADLNLDVESGHGAESELDVE